MTTPARARLAKTVGGGGAAIALLALVAMWEGKSNDPYRDIVGVWTVCYGETNVRMRAYSDAECDEMLADSLDGYARGVLEVTPGLRGHPHQTIAATSLAYNIGQSAYSRSTARRLWNAGDMAGGCRALTRYNKVRVPASQVARYRARGERCTSSGEVWYCTVRGLTRRREAEYRVCMTGLG